MLFLVFASNRVAKVSELIVEIVSFAGLGCGFNDCMVTQSGSFGSVFVFYSGRNNDMRQGKSNCAHLPSALFIHDLLVTVAGDVATVLN